MKKKLEKYLPPTLFGAIEGVPLDGAAEIRLRTGQAVTVRYAQHSERLPFVMPVGLADEVLSLFCGYSLYAYAADIARGFITVDGFRVGISGRVIFSNGESRGIKNVSGLNIRIPRQVKGCADRLLPFVLSGGRIKNTLIVSPPVCGKTTLLRDAVRQISDSGVNTVVIDERSEIACLGPDGIPQNDVGKNTDVLDGCAKAAGVMMALRSLAPELTALDEIGDKADVQAINRAVTGGAAVICTVHSDSIEALKRKKYILPLLEDKLFERIVLLRGVGDIYAVYDAECERIC